MTFDFFFLGLFFLIQCTDFFARSVPSERKKCLHAGLKFSVCDIGASLKGAHVPVLDKPSVTRMLESSRFQADKHLFVCCMNRM